MISRQASRSVVSSRGHRNQTVNLLRATAIISALLTICFLLVACDSTPAATSAVDEEVQVEAEPRTLTVYSGRSQSLVDPILKEFEVLTGIPVEIRYASTGEMAATLLRRG